ncbi:hypothetical protein ACEPAF_419 [Sanghuangporus sanghuang]
MSVRVLSPEELEIQLNRLHNVLSSLPSSLPCSSNNYYFIGFGPDPDILDLVGSVPGAVNNALENAFAPMGRINGITLLERGPGLVAVVDVLRGYTKDFPTDVVLQKWITDLTEAGIKAGGSIVSIDAIMPEFRPEPEETVSVGEKRKKHRQDSDQPKKQQILASSAVNNTFIDIEWAELDALKGKGGRKRDPLIVEVVIPGYMKKGPDEPIYYRCVGSGRGCAKIFDKSNGYRERFFYHAAGCGFVPTELKQRVNNALGKTALGNQLDAHGTSTVPTSCSSCSPSSCTPDRFNGPLTDWARGPGRTELNKKINFAVIKFLCACAIPPTVIDSKEWKEVLASSSGGQYQTVSSKFFVNALIPREAAHIHNRQIEILQKSNNLTISFDGGTTAALQSVYTVHVTTPDRRSYLVEGNEASAQSHTGEHLFRVLDQILTTIGPTRFKGITSDNTGNTSLARVKVRDAYPWILILPDPCHRLSLLCKDIAKFDYFRSTIKNLQRTITYFSNSSAATTKLTRKRNELGIPRGIEKIGKTRFGTLFFAAQSVLTNYRAISDLCKASNIVINDVNHLFMGGRPALEFECGLEELTAVLAPIAKVISCLESSHSTVSDVYYFWLAVAAETHQVLAEKYLPNQLKELIRRAVNYRFNQMVNQAPSDAYVCGFLLDPRFRDADIVRDLNPLALQKLKIPARDSSGKLLVKNGTDTEPQMPPSLRRAGTFLLGMLRTQYENLKIPIVGLSAQDANVLLKQQLVKYTKAIYPFDRPFHDTDHAGGWWKQLDIDRTNDAQPLAKLARTLFEVLPNSMVDERTASTIKWYNSRLRNRQQVPTLIRMTTIRQWYRGNEKDQTSSFRPTVRFRDMKETLNGSKSTIRADKPDLEGKRDNVPNSAGNDNDNEDNEEISDTVEESNEEFDIDALEDDSEQHRKFSGTKLDLEDTINIKSPILLDLWADEDHATKLKEDARKEQGNGKQVDGRGQPNMDLGNEEIWKM